VATVESKPPESTDVALGFEFILLTPN